MILLRSKIYILLFVYVPFVIGEESESEHVRMTKKFKTLSNEERQAIYLALQCKKINGRPQRGTLNDISKRFSVSRRTISRLWKTSKNMVDGVVDVRHQKNKCRCKKFVVN